MNTSFHEVNFDGLVGPTHHYGGHSFGNIASTTHGGKISNPRGAALQGIEKMSHLIEQLNLKQAFFLPVQRPPLKVLHQLGFTNTSAKKNFISFSERFPELVSPFFSASSMWTANCATICPSLDSLENKTQFTPANLQNKVHRFLESPYTYKLLNSIFNDSKTFNVHSPLPNNMTFGDEGAANHTRLCSTDFTGGIQLYVHGWNLEKAQISPQKFPARQSYQAFKAIESSHQTSCAIHLQQNPEVIDAGVFHNDVISVGHKNVLLVHEKAYLDQEEKLNEVQKMWSSKNTEDLHIIEIKEKDLSVINAVKSYLFNSQIVDNKNSSDYILICPEECKNNTQALAVINRIIADKNTINDVCFFDLKQSMENGGGPACLRLRVLLNDEEIAKTHQGVFLDSTRIQQLKSLVQNYYRDQLSEKDLFDPQFFEECLGSYQALEQFYDLKGYYLL